MVREHLPVVFAAFLDVDNHYLLQPESELCEIVELHSAGHVARREVGPELAEV